MAGHAEVSLNAAADASAALVKTVGLHTAEPGVDGTTAEVSGSNYSRAAADDWSGASGGIAETSAEVQFATPSGSWGACTHYSLWGTGPVFLGGFALGATRTPTSGADVDFAAGDLTITAANPA